MKQVDENLGNIVHFQIHALMLAWNNMTPNKHLRITYYPSYLLCNEITIGYDIEDQWKTWQK